MARQSKSVYLCGSMSGQKGLGAKWRKSIQRWLEQRGQKVFNPCEYEEKEFKKVPRHEWEKIPLKIRLKIMDRDGKQIEQQTSYLICYWTRPSTGTVSEIFTAFRKKIPCYFVARKNIPGWPGTIALKSGNKVFNTFDQLKKFLTKQVRLV